MMNEQITFFEDGTPFKITKPLRLITLFSGYDSQALALKYLGVPFEHYKTCEWAVPSIQALKDLHFGDDTTDYSATLSDLEIVDFLDGRISTDYNTPMTRAQIMRKSEKWRRTVYNNMKASRNVGSIVKATADDLHIVDTGKYDYLLTYSFPCQDLSTAGKGGGMARGSGTRSGMLWEVERLLGECKELPQVLVMENVPEVIGAKNIKHFSEWVAVLDELGYKSKWQVLNGTDFNVPQNRKRCFMVSVLGDYYYTFPRKQGCKLRLKDVLESDVDEKYYLSNSLINCFMEHTRKQKEKGNCFEWNVSTGDNIGSCVTTRAGWRPQDNYIAMGVNLDTSDSFRKAPMVEKARTLLANKSNCGGGVIMAETDKKYSVVKLPHGYYNGEVKEAEHSPTIDTGVGNWHTLIGEEDVQHCECVGLLAGDNFDGAFESVRRVYSAEQASPTLTTCGGGQREVKICEPIALDEQNSQLRLDGTVGTIVTDGSSPKHNNRVMYPSMKIRKLTEKECWRLMGVKDEDFEKVRKNQSMTSLYHLAGDSIITNCLMAIFKEIL